MFAAYECLGPYGCGCEQFGEGIDRHFLGKGRNGREGMGLRAGGHLTARAPRSYDGESCGMREDDVHGPDHRAENDVAPGKLDASIL